MMDLGLGFHVRKVLSAANPRRPKRIVIQCYRSSPEKSLEDHDAILSDPLHIQQLLRFPSNSHDNDAGGIVGGRRINYYDGVTQLLLLLLLLRLWSRCTCGRVVRAFPTTTQDGSS
jgi:hypothetical protein